MGCSGCEEKTKATMKQLDMFDEVASSMRSQVLLAEKANLGPVVTTIAYLERIEELRAGVARLKASLGKAEEKLERFVKPGEYGTHGTKRTQGTRGRK